MPVTFIPATPLGEAPAVPLATVPAAPPKPLPGSSVPLVAPVVLLRSLTGDQTKSQPGAGNERASPGV